MIHNLNMEMEFIRQSGVPECVNFPHTWNSFDGQDGRNNYYSGICSYTRTFYCLNFDRDAYRVYIEFLGVNSIAEVTLIGDSIMHHEGGYSTFRKDTTEVTLNGNRIMYHEGGYSTFRKDITEFLENENTLQVTVDNSVNNQKYPQMAQFTFYGGVYRNVQLIVVSKDHFEMDYYGETGTKITPERKVMLG